MDLNLRQEVLEIMLHEPVGVNEDVRLQAPELVEPGDEEPASRYN
jgi:hypothetical protein